MHLVRSADFWLALNGSILNHLNSIFIETAYAAGGNNEAKISSLCGANCPVEGWMDNQCFSGKVIVFDLDSNEERCYSPSDTFEVVCERDS